MLLKYVLLASILQFTLFGRQLGYAVNYTLSGKISYWKKTDGVKKITFSMSAVVVSKNMLFIPLLTDIWKCTYIKPNCRKHIFFHVDIKDKHTHNWQKKKT